MNSIKTKLVLVYAAVILIVMTVSGTVMLWNVRSMEFDRAVELCRGRANNIYSEIVQLYDTGGFIDADTWRALNLSEYEIDGMILNDIGIPIAPLEFIAHRPSSEALTRAVAGQEHFSIGRTSPTPGGPDSQFISFARPVTRDGITFIIYTRISTEAMNEALTQTVFTLIQMIAVALVLTLIMWFILANTLTAPITKLSHYAKSIATGDFSQQMTPKSTDEIGHLIYNFNEMAEELSGTLTAMASERNKREAILQNTTHGVLAYDAAGILTHANNASIDLISGLDVTKATLNEVLMLLGFDQTEIENLKPEEIRETTYQDCDFFILACVTAYTSQTDLVDGFIIVLQDVSRQMKLDNMRKEFVANVSHELRTPLTSIRTYTETLLDGAVEDAGLATQFLKVIEEEANRMTLLVTDLLELSRIDSKQAALDMDVVDLVALLRLSVRQSQFLAASKGQKIETDVKPDACFVEANASRINQVISNILSNSIKYSPENTTIKVSMEITDKYYRIFVQDQGMGIPPESLPRVFERFYRVDKARARAMGGTGLGLAIVKEIMEEHGGRVHASSQVGVGTTMVLRFNRFSGGASWED